MPTFVEYQNEDGSTILIELPERSGDIVRSTPSEMSVIKTGKKFAEAFTSIRSSIKDLIHEMDALEVQEGEVKFGLKALAEAGLFAVGKIGGDMNYEVTLKWTKREEKSKTGSKN